MELKNAVAVCLISLFSATLVVLIARSLDSQAASRLEPQLARIVEELEAIRKHGGLARASNQEAASLPADDALMVYYFHGVRCANCRAAESNAHAAIESRYASQLESGEIVWEVRDYMNDPVAKEMKVDFNVVGAAIVLVKMKDGEMQTWNRLDQTLTLAKDKPALSAYLQGEIDEMLKTPDVETDDLPLPADPARIPLPE